MNKCFQFFITLIMFLTMSVMAQKTKGQSMEWKVATEIRKINSDKPSLGYAGSVIGVHNKLMFIAGGANFPTKLPWQGGIKEYYSTIFIFLIENEKLRQVENSFALPEPIAYAAVCNTKNGILYAGGENINGISKRVWLMQWDKKKQEPFFKEMPSLPIHLTNASAVFVNDEVYFAGGETTTGTTSQFYKLNLKKLNLGWIRLADLPSQVSHVVMMTSSEKKKSFIYLAGGRKKNTNGISGLSNTLYAYNINSDAWEIKKPMPYTLSAGTGIMYDNDNFVLFGGDRGTVFTNVETLIAGINSENDQLKKQELINKKNKLQSQHPGFNDEILLYNIKSDKWKSIGNMPFSPPVSTTAVKWKSCIFLPSGEIRPGIRTPDILSVKITPIAQ